MNKLTKHLSVLEKNLLSVIQYQGISNRLATYLLLSIVVFTALLRLLTIRSPSLDRTNWKEIDHIMISQNFYEHGYNFFKPEISWPAEEPRITAMELPLAPFLASLLYPVLGINEYSVRMATQFAFLLLVIFMYKLVHRETGPVLALATAFFSAILPMFSSFRNSLFSEPLMIFLSVFAIYHFAQWTDRRKLSSLLSFIFGFAITIALKPTALYLVIPLCYIHYRKFKLQPSRYLPFIGYLSLAMILPVLWYLHAYHLSKTYIDVFGVFGGQFGGHDKFQTLAMLTNLDWYTMMYWRIKSLLLGESGLLFVMIGIITAIYLKKGRLFIAYLIAIIAFFIIVAEGNFDTSYRQLTIIPPGSFLLALGSVTAGVSIYTILNALFPNRNRRAAKIVSTLFCLLFLAVFPIRKPYLFIPGKRTAPAHPIQWELAREIKKAASDSSKIIMAGEYTIHKGGNDLSPVTYYYSGLKGWPIQEGQWNEAVINSLKMKGADLLGAVEYGREPELADFIEALSAKYPVLYSEPESGVILIQLRGALHHED